VEGATPSVSCMLLQLLVPLLVDMHSMMQIVTSEDPDFQDQSVVPCSKCVCGLFINSRFVCYPGPHIACMSPVVAGSILHCHIHAVASVGSTARTFCIVLLP